METSQAADKAQAAEAHALDAAATDPVCGMRVDPVAPKGGTAQHDGVTYGFCSTRCRERFQADPLRYLHPEQHCRARSTAGRHVHVPHASGSAAARSGHLPVLRHGAGTGNAEPGRGRQSRIA